ncbi:MAG: hypothetical protein GY796_05960 [Chloroflexi bacterium]|nr:hypothetical protein [Chloroflexota bacterium]
MTYCQTTGEICSSAAAATGRGLVVTRLDRLLHSQHLPVSERRNERWILIFDGFLFALFYKPTTIFIVIKLIVIKLIWDINIIAQ